MGFTSAWTVTTFGQVRAGERFRLLHLLRTPMVKVPKRMSNRTGGRKPFVGEYNAVAVGGGRWVWEDEQVVLVPK